MSNEIVHMPVADVMTPYLITIEQYENLAKAYEIMVKNKIRRLPVTDNNKLVGIITMSDVLKAEPSDVRHSLNIEELNELLSTFVVDKVMKRNPVKVYQNDTLGHAAEVMLNEKIGGLPVIDTDNKLVGLITESDIFRTIVKKWRDDNVLYSSL